ncbi:hypothetical protein B0H17DRAFT_1180100 [Mycena rosella]|uniref:Uncharacterized protein n=1 Tax=Mycena rosella TaxID=1033263 RepID=A0AAD7DEL7_MYCRO|nr:hypothetical protein B0H17DRAFT_1180100 [Mycena rosella]
MSHLGNADSKIFESNWLSLRGAAAVVARSWALSPPSVRRKRAGGEEAVRSGEDEREGIGCEGIKDGVHGNLNIDCEMWTCSAVENVADARGDEAQEGAEGVCGLGGEVVLDARWLEKNWEGSS